MLHKKKLKERSEGVNEAPQLGGGELARLPLEKGSSKPRGPERRVALAAQERTQADGALECRAAMLWPFFPSVWPGQPQALRSELPASLRGY